MAKAWVWVLVGVFIIAMVWIGDYWYNYYTIGTCRDDHGNAYPCGKSYRYSDNYDYNYLSYSYYDSYGNRVVVNKEHNFDDYYDCYHASIPDSRYGQLLREDYGIRCWGYEVLNDNPITYYSNSEKAPIIYVK